MLDLERCIVHCLHYLDDLFIIGKDGINIPERQKTLDEANIQRMRLAGDCGDYNTYEMKEFTFAHGRFSIYWVQIATLEMKSACTNMSVSG